MDLLLEENGLSEYVNIIKDNKLTLSDIRKLDLKTIKDELGIVPLGDRIRLKKLAESDNYHMDSMNVDNDSFIKYRQLSKGELDLSDIVKNYPLGFVKKILSNAEYEILLTEYPSFATQGVINAIFEKKDIQNKYNFQNDLNVEDETFSLFENYFNSPNTCKDEEFLLPLIKSPNKLNFINSKDDFMKKFYATIAILDGVDWDGIVVAGGSLSSNFFGYESKSSDIDIFIVKEMNDDKIREKIKNIYDTVKKNTNRVPLIFRTPHTITLFSGYPHKYIQIVLRMCKSITELLSFFDLDCCVLAYDGKDVVSIPRILRVVRTGCNFVDVRKLNNLQFISRIRKYLEKGFSFRFGLYGIYPDEKDLKFIKEKFALYSENITNSSNKGLKKVNDVMYENIKLPFDESCNISRVKEYIKDKNSTKTNYELITLENLLERKDIVDKNWRSNIYIVKDFIRKCYSCKLVFSIDTANKKSKDGRDEYPKLCESCYNKNNKMKSDLDKINFHKKIVFITGGRINIGYELCLYLLRRGAIVLTTSRFPKSAIYTYKKCKDFDSWGQNLHIYGVDFRNKVQVESLINDVYKKFNKMDILINCAAQTIKRSVDYYKDQISFEMSRMIELEKSNIIQFDESAFSTILAHDSNKKSVHSSSWTSKLMEIDTNEIAEALVINSLTPTMFVKYFKDILMNSDNPHIINVSSPEGLFSSYKNTNHPHTNMAKAALNMLTRTSALDYYENYGIIMNCVDTGWVTSMMDSENCQYGKLANPPLKVQDAVQRVLYPLIANVNGPNYGKFYQEFKIVDW